MDNTHQPPGGEPQDFWATQEIRPEAGQPGWQQPPGPPAQAGPPGPPRPPRRSKTLWWGAGLALVAVLAGGGAFAATQLAGNTSPAGASSGATGPTGQAAQLNALLNSASSPSSAVAAASFGTASSGPTAATAGTARRPCATRATKLKKAGHPFAARYAARLCRRALARVRLVGGLHGQFTFKAKSGYKTLAYERGVIQAISGNDVTVRASDGTTWTWVLVSSTVVRHGGQKVASSTLADGQQVFAGGPVVGGVNDARLIVIRPAGGSSPTPSASPAAGS
jgi:hypothetical protein